MEQWLLRDVKAGQLVRVHEPGAGKLPVCRVVSTNLGRQLHVPGRKFRYIPSCQMFCASRIDHWTSSHSLLCAAKVEVSLPRELFWLH